MHIHVSYMYIDVHIQRESADTYQDHIHQGQTCIINRKHRVNYQTNLMSRGARALLLSTRDGKHHKALCWVLSSSPRKKRC